MPKIEIEISDAAMAGLEWLAADDPDKRDDAASMAQLYVETRIMALRNAGKIPAEVFPADEIPF